LIFTRDKITGITLVIQYPIVGISEGLTPKRSEWVSLRRLSGEKSAIPFPRIFYDPLLCIEIYMNQAEPRMVTFGPFKVIGKRPNEVTMDIQPVLFCPKYLGKMVYQV